VAWSDCTEGAVDRVADQPEPARTVAEAAIAACWPEKYRYTAAMGDAPIVANLQAIDEASMPDLVARVMANRAARPKLRKEAPSPAIDYNRM
jgi:hypothetical protein